MLKKVLCLVIAVVMIMATSVVTSVGATSVDEVQTCAGQTKNLMMGDVNLDGQISIMDVTELQLALAGLVELTEEQWYVSTTTNSEEASVLDATEIQRYLAGLECDGCTGEIVTNKGNENDDNVPTVDNIESIEKAIAKRFIEYVNQERTRVGVQQLTVNADLTKAAEIRSDELVESFSHTRPDGTSCFTAIENRSDFWVMGENVAYNAGVLNFNDAETLNEDIDNAASFFYGQFKSSEGHYRNMIRSDFNCNGVGVAIVKCNGYTKCYMAHMFGEAKS